VIDEGTRFARLLSRELSSPLREQSGLRFLDHGHGCVDEAMDVPPWLRDADDAVTPAALLILADSALAAAVSTTIAADRAPVTRRLGLELLARAPVRDDTVVARAQLLDADAERAVVRGDLFSGDELVAVASMRTAVVADPGRAGADTRTAAVTVPVTARPGPIAAAWPLDRVPGAAGATVVRAHAHAWQANSIGTLHGGVVAAIGERALGEAVVRSEPQPQRGSSRPGRAILLDVVVDFLRPIRADGAPVEVRTEIRHRSARVVVALGSIDRADGATAALVHATIELDDRDEREAACSSG
jgi:acyl-coenzyme A thioesterase PaaI-like protein